MFNRQMGIVGLVLLLFSSGCAHQSLHSDVDPSSNIDQFSTFYVARFPSDNRGIEELISRELMGMGKQVTWGDSQEPPAEVDVLVTYADKWMWDITMYMIELSVDLRDPVTGYVMAAGRSYRTSLVRKSPEDMVSEVLSDIFEEAQSD